jgi:hypothetical protein
MIASKLGTHQELDIEVTAVKPRFQFGPTTGENIYFSTEIKVGVKKAGDMNFLVFDQFLFETAFDFSIKEEVMYANFKYLTVSKAGENLEREKPVFDSMDFTSEDYDDFWSYVEIKNEKWLNYFNT